MKAPDTIYFPADGLPAYIDWDGSPIRTKQVDDSDVCYVRNDALIEWLNKKLQESADRLDFHANQAYAEVIDKLNKM